MKRKPPLLLLLLLCLIISPLFYSSVKASPAYEDFTTYTEVDVGADRIQFNSTHINHTARRDEDTYLYKDYGENYFENFTHYVDIYCDEIEASANGFVWGLANDTDDVKAIQSANNESLWVLFRYDAEGYHIYLRETYDGSNYQTPTIYFGEDTWYYLNITKVGDLIKIIKYDSAEDRAKNLEPQAGNGVEPRSLSLHGNWNFKYIYGCNTANTGHTFEAKTRIRFLDLSPIPLIYYEVTFYFNNGGIFRVNNITITNSSIMEYLNGTILELASLPQNSTYVFSYFSWDSYNSTTNPYNLTITSDLTVWCYFSVPSVDGVYMGYGLALLTLIMGLVIGVLVSSKK